MMALCLGEDIALTEDLNLIPSTHVGKLKIVCNSSSKGAVQCQWSSVAVPGLSQQNWHVLPAQTPSRSISDCCKCHQYWAVTNSPETLCTDLWVPADPPDRHSAIPHHQTFSLTQFPWPVFSFQPDFRDNGKALNHFLRKTAPGYFSLWGCCWYALPE